MNSYCECLPCAALRDMERMEYQVNRARELQEGAERQTSAFLSRAMVVETLFKALLFELWVAHTKGGLSQTELWEIAKKYEDKIQ